jgi:hypothetical protein
VDGFRRRSRGDISFSAPLLCFRKGLDQVDFVIRMAKMMKADLLESGSPLDQNPMLRASVSTEHQLSSGGEARGDSVIV